MSSLSLLLSIEQRQLIIQRVFVLRLVVFKSFRGSPNPLENWSTSMDWKRKKNDFCGKKLTLFVCVIYCRSPTKELFSLSNLKHWKAHWRDQRSKDMGLASESNVQFQAAPGNKATYKFRDIFVGLKKKASSDSYSCPSKLPPSKLTPTRNQG